MTTHKKLSSYAIAVIALLGAAIPGFAQSKLMHNNNEKHSLTTGSTGSTVCSAPGVFGFSDEALHKQSQGSNAPLISVPYDNNTDFDCGQLGRTQMMQNIQTAIAFNAEKVSLGIDQPQTTPNLERRKNSIVLQNTELPLTTTAIKGWDQLTADEKKLFGQQLDASAAHWNALKSRDQADGDRYRKAEGKSKPVVFVYRRPQPPKS